jgi:hypothetical protein
MLNRSEAYFKYIVKYDKLVERRRRSDEPVTYQYWK